jgi:hypothetical protein
LVKEAKDVEQSNVQCYLQFVHKHVRMKRNLPVEFIWRPPSHQSRADPENGGNVTTWRGLHMHLGNPLTLRLWHVIDSCSPRHRWWFGGHAICPVVLLNFIAKATQSEIKLHFSIAKIRRRILSTLEEGVQDTNWYLHCNTWITGNPHTTCPLINESFAGGTLVEILEPEISWAERPHHSSTDLHRRRSWSKQITDLWSWTSHFT